MHEDDDSSTHRKKSDSEGGANRMESELERIIAEVSEKTKGWDYNVDPTPGLAEASEESFEETEFAEDSVELNHLERHFLATENRLLEEHQWMEQQVAGIRTAIEQLGGGGEKREQLYDELHQMIREYRELFILETVEKPILLDLLLLYDTINRCLESLAELPDIAESSLDKVRGIREELLEALFRRDVRRIELLEGEVDRRLQKVVGVRPPDENDEAGPAFMVVKDGFIWRGKALRPQEIIIRRPRNGNGNSEDTT